MEAARMTFKEEALKLRVEARKLRIENALLKRTNHALTMTGASVVLFSAILSTGLNYLLTHQLNYSAGLFTLVAAAIVGYLVERKAGSRNKFFGR